MEVGQETTVLTAHDAKGEPSVDGEAGDDYVVQLAMFEGPMELLYQLVRKDEIDIWDIPIAHLTEQYLAYLETLHELSIEPAAEFLVMAARLIQIKVRTLLPPAETDEDEDEEDPRLALAFDLYEYALFKEAAESLAALGEGRHDLHGRPESARPPFAGVVYPDPAGGATLLALGQAFLELLESVAQTPTVPVPRTRVSVSEKIAHLRRLFLTVDRVDFLDLFAEEKSRPVIVAVFLAMLELVRDGTLGLQQDEPSAPIVVFSRPRRDAAAG